MDSVKFNHGDVVYLKICPDEASMVTGILFRPSSVTYYVTWGSGNEYTHYDIELTKDKIFASELS